MLFSTNETGKHTRKRSQRVSILFYTQDKDVVEIVPLACYSIENLLMPHVAIVEIPRYFRESTDIALQHRRKDGGVWPWFRNMTTNSRKTKTFPGSSSLRTILVILWGQLPMCRSFLLPLHLVIVS